MIEKKKSRQGYYSISEILKDVKENARLSDPESPTAKEVLLYMIGDSEGWYAGEYVVHKYQGRTRKTFFQRFNTFWFYPLFALSIPFQYLFTGSYGVKRNTKAGHIVEKLIGFD